MSPTGTHHHLVVGAGGLLGGGIVSELRGSWRGSVVARAVVPWHDDEASVLALSDAFATMISAEVPWTLFWCAGAAVVASSPESLARERSVVARSLAALAEHLGAHPGSAARGTVVMASSAGGVYAGSVGAPFTEATMPRPLAAYGASKLETEGLFTRFAENAGLRLAVARYSNLYGPGQDTSKAQGLVSQLCLAHLQNRPSSIYVPVDTIRDYLYVDDAASMTVDLARRVAELPEPQTITKIVASQQGVTIAALISELQRVVKRRPRIVFGSHFTASAQALDLRFESHVLPSVDHRVLTPLTAGIHATLLSLQAGSR